MFSIDLDSKQLSVEHTHPPSELVLDLVKSSRKNIKKTMDIK